jgi:hypothetical protein
VVPTGHGQQPQALEMAPGLVAVRPSIALPVNPANGAAAGLAWPSGAGPDDGERAQEGGHKLRRGALRPPWAARRGGGDINTSSYVHLLFMF